MLVVLEPFCNALSSFTESIWERCIAEWLKKHHIEADCAQQVLKHHIEADSSCAQPVLVHTPSRIHKPDALHPGEVDESSFLAAKQMTRVAREAGGGGGKSRM